MVLLMDEKQNKIVATKGSELLTYNMNRGTTTTGLR